MSDPNLPTPPDESQRESGVNISGESQVNAKNVIGGDYVVHGSVYNVQGNLTINQGAVSSPSSSAPHFFVPFPHNPDFVGRETELATLHAMLQQGSSPVGIRPTVLVGLGGIGKTQLAVEYAHAHRDDYPGGVFWLNAINPLLLEFADLAQKLNMAETDTPRDKAARAAWDYLDAHPNALVIFDNVLEPSELNIPFSPDLVPANLRCRTLFTTRQRDFPRNFQPFEVKVLPEMAAMKLLLRSRPEVLEEQHPEWGWARIVCAELGWLPLALELAAAYLGAYSEVSITGYLERLRTEGSLETVDASEVRAVDLPTRVEEILKAAAIGNLETKHQVAVSATLQTQWRRLDDEDARLIFRAAGQFPEASFIPIPRLGLLTGIESEAKAGRPSTLSVGLKKLHAVSLIEELGQDRLRLHPLVQEFAARLSPASFRVEMAERVAAELNDLMRLQTYVIHYGIDMALEDARVGLGFCSEGSESDFHSHLSNLERVLDRQAYCLRGWDSETQPAFFLQQLRNESFELGIDNLRARAEALLNKENLAYVLRRFCLGDASVELVRTLHGHRGSVYSVALGGDGRLAVSASADRSLKVWDIATGRELHSLQGHTKAVTCIAMCVNNSLAVSGSYDKTLRVWDVATGRETRTLEGHNDYVTCVALSADGRVAISASRDNTLRVWEIATGRLLCTLQEEYIFDRIFLDRTAGVKGVDLSADGHIAVSASRDGSIKVWEISTSQNTGVMTGHNISILKGHTDAVNSVALSADGRWMVSASDDQTLKIWDVATGQELHELCGHYGPVCGVALSPDAQLIISTSKDNTLAVWEFKTGRVLRTFHGHNAAVYNVVLSADGRMAISASQDKTLKVWDISSLRQTQQKQYLATKRETPKISRQDGSVKGVDLSADGRLAISISQNNKEKVGEFKVWDAITGQVECTLARFEGGLNNYRMKLGADQEKGETVLPPRSVNDYKYPKRLSIVKLSADGSLAVCASRNKTIEAWNSATSNARRILGAHDATVNGIAVSADGNLAISASDDKTLKVWDVLTSRELRTLKGHMAAVNDVDLSVNGQLAISASQDETLKVWEVATGREISTLIGHNEKVKYVALNADGRLAVSSSYDNSLKLWDVRTGRELHTLIAHSGEVNGIAISANGRLVVSASSDKTIKVWAVTTGRCIATLPVGASVQCCAMSADGTTIIAGDELGWVHFFEVVNASEI